ncbi:pyridoxamine 5'-phosphate oxidase family protein [Catenulispora yoronensis]
MALTVKFDGTDTPTAVVGHSVEAIAAGTQVLSLATADAAGTPHANMAFFALGREFDLFFVSEPSTLHGRNAEARAQASAAIWLPPPEFGEGLRGMQLTGECGIARGADALAAFEAYQGRFPGFGTDPRCGSRSWTAARPRASTDSGWRGCDWSTSRTSGGVITWI